MMAKSVHECNNNNVQLRLRLKTRIAHDVSINVSLIIFVESFVATGRPVRFLKYRSPVTVSLCVEDVPGRFPESLPVGIAMAKLITSSILQRRRRLYNQDLTTYWLLSGFFADLYA
ncbi:unnamed protein product [Sphagnum jensenii]|uniref:Uncharacterized protein n=1 Tax=Sphagnum jensenii TaxID=128206 RepID=A0ABP1B1K1_9BRYO